MDTGVAGASNADPAASEDRARLLAALAVGCFWIVPVIGPLVLRPLMGGRSFALHYFRLALIIQVVLVVGVGFSAISTIWPDTSVWTGAISIPAWLWSLYGSVVCLMAALRGECRDLRPIPGSWLWPRR